MRGAQLPYRSSTVDNPLPRVLLYTPAMTLHDITFEQETEMVYNLVLVRSVLDFETIFARPSPFAVGCCYVPSSYETLFI